MWSCNGCTRWVCFLVYLCYDEFLAFSLNKNVQIKSLLKLIELQLKGSENTRELCIHPQKKKNGLLHIAVSYQTNGMPFSLLFFSFLSLQFSKPQIWGRKANKKIVPDEPWMWKKLGWSHRSFCITFQLCLAEIVLVKFTLLRYPMLFNHLSSG